MLTTNSDALTTTVKVSPDFAKFADLARKLVSIPKKDLTAKKDKPTVKAKPTKK